MRLYRHDDPRHAEASALLPWFANGTLSPDERAHVELHVSDCIGCKQELQRLRSWQNLYRAEAPEIDMERGLARVQARIDEIEASVASPSPWRRALAMWR